MEEMDVDNRGSLIDIEIYSAPGPSRSTNIYGSPIARRVGQNESGEAIASTSVAFPSADSDRVVRNEIIFCLLTVQYLFFRYEAFAFIFLFRFVPARILAVERRRQNLLVALVEMPR